MKWVICLCDLTGIFAEPWTHFGYSVLLVDPQHTDLGQGPYVKFPGTIDDALPLVSTLIRSRQVAFVAGFPPCTDVAVSGARWWDEKRLKDPYFQARATRVAESCRMIGELSGAPWFFENPISAFSSIFGPPQHKFSPPDYAAYWPEDQYNKETWLWSGGGFQMPSPRPAGSLGVPDNRIWLAADTANQANIRSETPRGFSIACMLANCPEVLE